MKNPVMKSLAAFVAVAFLMTLIPVPSFAQVAKPGTPSVIKIVSGAKYVKSGKSFVNVTVSANQPSIGGVASTLTVKAGAFTCTIKLPAAKCVLVKVPNKAALLVIAQASNAGGSGPRTAPVRYTAGAKSWPSLAAAPSIKSITSRGGNVTINFISPVSASAAAITNYAYSVDGGQTWIRRTPASTASPINLLGVSQGARTFKIRAINAAGQGAPSLGKAHTVTASAQTLLPIKFKPLKNAKALVLTQTTVLKSMSGRINRAGIRPMGDVATDSTTVSIVQTNGTLVPAVDAQTAPVNIDRIFIGPNGRTIATLGSNAENCSVAEINTSTGDTACLTTKDEASLQNVAIDAQQLAGLQPVKFDSLDNVFISSFNSLLRITPAGEKKTLIPASAKMCIQKWTPLESNDVAAWVNENGNGCGGQDSTFAVSTAGGSVVNKPLCQCATYSMAPLPGGGLLMSDGTTMYRMDNSFKVQTIAQQYSSTLLYQNSSHPTLLSDNRIIAIPGNFWGEIHFTGTATPLMQYYPEVSNASQPTFDVQSVPVPMMLAKMTGKKIAVAGLADAANCWRYASIWDYEPSCRNEARLATYDFNTNTETQIDLVSATGGNSDPMNIFFLSGTPDGKTIYFAGNRFRTTGNVVGVVNIDTGNTVITPVAGFLGLSAY